MAGQIAEAYVQIIPTTDGISQGIAKGLGDEGERGGKSFGAGLVGAFKKIVAVAGIGKIVKDALTAGGDLQQSFGGLETIYGEAADGAKAYARAAAEAGISANTYAEQAVSFGAALKQAYEGDTIAAMEAANTAILDMADNSAKMGTDIGSIQAAYQGFAKQNYTMLDNLKLGYGGTKTEMERLLADAQKLSGVEYNIDNLGDVYDAIHVIQQDLGLTGVAALEASTTLTGSFGAMKAAAKNFLADLSLGNDLKASLNQLTNSVIDFAGNAVPMITNIISAAPEALTNLIVNLAPSMIENGAVLIASLVSGIVSSIPALVAALPEIWNALVTGFEAAWPVLQAAGEQLLQMVGAGLQAAAGWLQGIASELWQPVKDKAVEVWNSIAAAVSSVWNTIKNAVTVGVMAIGSILQAAWTIITLPWRLVWENCKETITAVWSSISSFVSSALTAVSSVISSVWTSVVGFLGPIHESIKSGFSEAWSSASSTVSSYVSTIGSKISSGLETAKSSAASILDGLKSKFAEIFDGIKGTLTPVIDWLKGIFNFSWSLPHIKLPHFSISGSFSLDPPSVPSLSVSWYAKGAVLDGATIFGMSGGSLLGGGEAGPEAVAPIDVLQGYIRDAVSSSASERDSGKLDELIAAVMELSRKLDRLGLYLDGDTLVGGIVERMDVALGERDALTGRGLA